MDWAEKYRPQHIADLQGNKEVIRRLVTWAQEWMVGTKPLLIYGKAGIGKTSAAYALARDMDWDVIELNASDQRTKGAIERVAGSASTHSFTGNRRLVLLDEADNLHGSADRGGAKAVVDVIKASQQPIILIANDLYGVDAAIKAVCDPVVFRSLQSRSLAPLLRSIARQEGKNIDESVLVDIADRASGDIRCAVNMLYAASIGIDEHISLPISGKDKRSTIFDIVSATFEARDPRVLPPLSFEIDETPDQILLWLEENVTRVKDPHALSACYRLLSHADLFLGRTLKTQYYTLWRYASGCMLFGVHAAATGHVIREKINPPSRFKKIGTAKRKRLIRQSLYRAIGTNLHMAQTTVREDYLRPVSVLSQQHPDLCARTLTDNPDLLTILLEDAALAKAIAKEIEKEKKEAEKAQKTLKKPVPKKKEGTQKKTDKTDKTDKTGKREKTEKLFISQNEEKLQGQTSLHAMEKISSPGDREAQVEQGESDQKQVDLFSFG